MSTLFRKLNLKEQKTITLINSPISFDLEVKNLLRHQIVTINRTTKGDDEIEWILIFVTQQREIASHIQQIKNLLIDDVVLWFAYPKKSSKNYQSDISRDQGWQPLGNFGWEGVRQVAIDDDWSALRFRKVEHIRHFTRRTEMAMTSEGKERTNQKNKQ